MVGERKKWSAGGETAGTEPERNAAAAHRRKPFATALSFRIAVRDERGLLRRETGVVERGRGDRQPVKRSNGRVGHGGMQGVTCGYLIDFMASMRHIWRVMKITKQATDETVLTELGGRLTRVRLERNLTQAQLAEQAGVSKRTVQRLEAGAVATQLSGFIRVCRVLDVLERFDTLIPEPVPSPVEQLKLHGRQRRRASAVKTVRSPAKKWQWGDKS